MPANWAWGADVVVIGAGATGLPAALAVGASLWGLRNQILENGDGSRTQRAIAMRYNYFSWDVNCPIFPLVHDTRTGLRINAQCQVMDMQGQVIPGLYCGGGSAGGFDQHGLGRCMTQGYIAGKNAAAERSKA